MTNDSILLLLKNTRRILPFFFCSVSFITLDEHVLGHHRSTTSSVLVFLTWVCHICVIQFVKILQLLNKAGYFWHAYVFLQCYELHIIRGCIALSLLNGTLKKPLERYISTVTWGQVISPDTCGNTWLQS